MPDKLDIQSHTSVYTANFDAGAISALNADVPADTHFIIDRHVADLYAGPLANVLSSPSVLLIDAVEPNKSLERMPQYVNHLVSRGVRRDHTLLAIGGGIIQDITCYLAATMLRGMDWRFLPTTLLAQADSCIGSKSSINCGDAKNILGTFTPPRRVDICVGFLDTLKETDVRSGVGEMLKVHVIAGPESFDALAADYHRLFDEPEVMQHYVRCALEIKKDYIEQDEFDQGIRNIFNYGHSFGHAIEAATEFAIPHGIAVTIGMDMANFVSWRLGVGGEDHFRRMHPTLKANYHGFEGHDVPLDKFLSAISKDKKNTGTGSVTLILPGVDGKVFRDGYANDDGFAALCDEYLKGSRAA